MCALRFRSLRKTFSAGILYIVYPCFVRTSALEKGGSCVRTSVLVMLLKQIPWYHSDIFPPPGRGCRRSRRGSLVVPGYLFLLKYYSVLLISTILYASTTSPTLISLYPAILRPQSIPATTSFTSSLNLLSEPSSPV